MQECASVGQMRAARAGWFGSVGFVPTMGALHEGHLALVRRARAETDHVVASIFVNPMHFASADEADRYPRTLDRNLALLVSEQIEVVFVPTADVLYPDRFATAIDVDPIALPLEGSSRPGHFGGVATVVAKLLNIVQPIRAYFGQNDAQQLLVIRRMLEDLNLPVEIVAVPTVRELDGLAISSRNMLLGPDGSRAARCLFTALDATRRQWDRGDRDAASLRNVMAETIRAEPRATLEYGSIADPRTRAECENLVPGPVLASLAVRIGEVRLIDNLVLGKGSPFSAVL